MLVKTFLGKFLLAKEKKSTCCIWGASLILSFLIPLHAVAGGFSTEHRQALAFECKQSTGRTHGGKFRSCLRQVREKLLAERSFADFSGLSDHQTSRIKSHCTSIIPAGLRAYDNCLYGQINAGPRNVRAPVSHQSQPPVRGKKIRLLTMVADCHGGESRKTEAIVRMVRKFQFELNQPNYQVFGASHRTLDDFEGGAHCREQSHIVGLSNEITPPIDIVVVLRASKRTRDGVIVSATAIDRLSGAFVGDAEADSRKMPKSIDLSERLSRMAVPLARDLIPQLSSWWANRWLGITIGLENIDATSQQKIVETLSRRLAGRPRQLEAGRLYYRFFFETKMTPTEVRHVLNEIFKEMDISVLPQATEREFIVQRIGSR